MDWPTVIRSVQTQLQFLSQHTVKPARSGRRGFIRVSALLITRRNTESFVRGESRVPRRRTERSPGYSDVSMGFLGSTCRSTVASCRQRSSSSARVRLNPASVSACWARYLRSIAAEAASILFSLRSKTLSPRASMRVNRRQRTGRVPSCDPAIGIEVEGGVHCNAFENNLQSLCHCHAGNFR